MKNKLDELGEFLMANLRDMALSKCDDLLEGKQRAPSLQKIQSELKELSNGNKDLLRGLVTEVVDSGIHDFLFALQESSDCGERVRICVDSVDAGGLSDGLQGELFSEEGWQAKYSEYGEAPDEP